MAKSAAKQAPAAKKAPVPIAAAPKPRAKPAPKKRRPGLLAPFIFTTVIVLLAITAMPICIMLIVGMIPSITAYLVDQTPRRMLTLTVAPFNFAGVVPFCMQLWFSPDAMQLMGQLITRPWVWMVMYAAAGAGWLLHFGMPLVVAVVLERSLDLRKAKYIAIQKSLKAEWGEAVGRAVDDKPVAADA
jgi:hypothetical protein